MGAVFLSYRREDAEGQAGRLHRDLVAAFGSGSVFMDVAAIQYGRDFRKEIDQSLDSCGVFLSLIGKSWLTAKDASGQRRLDDPADFVRIETAAVLKRDIPVIPILVQGASVPKPEQLPDDLKELAYRNAIELTHPRWDSDVQLLIKSLHPHVFRPTEQPEPDRKRIVAKSLALAAVILLVVAMAIYLRPGQKGVASSKVSESTETTTPPAEAANAPVAANAPRAETNQRSPKKSVSSQSPLRPNLTTLNDFSLVAEQEPLPDNPKRFTFTLSAKAPSATIDAISRVHYDLVYESNPLSLDGGSAPAFSAVYEGWGCYETVVVTVYSKSPGSQPLTRTFDMCKALKDRRPPGKN